METEAGPVQFELQIIHKLRIFFKTYDNRAITVFRLQDITTKNSTKSNFVKFGKYKGVPIHNHERVLGFHVCLASLRRRRKPLFGFSIAFGYALT